MTLGESFVDQAGEDGSQSWSLEVNWIDLGLYVAVNDRLYPHMANRLRATNDSDYELPRDSISGSPREGYQRYAVLEYGAEETLSSYFQDEPDRIIQDDIIRFWEGLFLVVDAVCTVHEISPEPFQGSNYQYLISLRQLTSFLAGTRMQNLRIYYGGAIQARTSTNGASKLPTSA